MSISRQELGQQVWYDADTKGYAMLDVTKYIPPLQSVEVEGVTLLPKHEYHVSIANLRGIAGENPEIEPKMVWFMQAYLADPAHQLEWKGLTGAYYLCQKPNAEGDMQRTLIGAVEIAGLAALERAMRQRFAMPITLSRPHVTLLKSANSPYGIGVNSPKDLAQLCRRQDELGEQLFE